uniref:Uncharacterized protein n=1 Tax=Oryza sativa subsp. japonica TaxID=39947 RepID=Q84UN6_ORYSJ|nr:hypothetical protein [Oryza sativa Japonica Group]
MPTTEAALRDDEPGDRRDVDDENERRRRRWTAEGFGWRGSDAEDDLAAAMPEKTATRSTGEIPARRNGRPEDSGEAGGGVGGDTAVVSGRIRGQAGVEVDAVTPREETARPART